MGDERTRAAPAWVSPRCLRSWCVASALLGSLLCSTAYARSARDLLRSGDFPAAVEVLRAEEARHPRNMRVKRQLGYALLESGDATGAVAKLLEARALRRRDQETLLLLGRAAESAGDRRLALEAYGAYLARGGRGADVVRARIRALTRAEAKASIRRALDAEKDIAADSIPANTVAVPEFAVPLDSDTLRPLSRGLAVVLITDLSQVPGLRVVERLRLGVLMRELAMVSQPDTTPEGLAARPQVVHPETAPRLGRLIGTRHFAQGTLVPLSESRIQLDAMLFDVPSATSKVAGSPVDGPVREVLALEKTLLFQLLDSLGVSPGPTLRRKIERPPTRSFEAFLAFSRAVDFEERGLDALALDSYGQALRLDPSFALAQERRDVLAVGAADHDALDEMVGQRVLEAANTTERLLRSGTQVGLRPWPSPHDPTVTSVARTGPVDYTITVHLP